MTKTSASNSKIKSAMQQPDNGVTAPGRTQAASFASQVAALAVGECCSRVVGVDPNVRLCELSTMLPAMRESLRNNTAPSVRQANTRTGNKYTIEVADVRTPGDNFFVVAIVTRTT